MAVALANIDAIIALIKAVKTPQEAKTALLAKPWPEGSVAQLLSKSAEQTRPDDLLDVYGLHGDGYHLSPVQAQAILDLRLHRLTGLEIDKIHKEYGDIIIAIVALLKILSDPDELDGVIREELEQIKSDFNDDRRTEIIASKMDLTHEDLIEEEDLVVTLSQHGYIKSQSVDSYQAQRRGGRGKMATSVKEEDYVKNILVAHSHDQILCFSSQGKVYWLKTYQVPQGGRQARGRPIINLLPLEKGESITAILPVKEYLENYFVFMATEKGVVKKVSLSEFRRQRSSGKIALELNEGDHLIGVDITNGSRDVMLMADSGKAIRFSENDVRAMDRTARGVRGIKLQSGQKLIKLIIIDETATILTATENGYGQRTEVNDYRPIGRGGQGVRAIVVNERNGRVVSAAQVQGNDDILMITSGGTMARTRVKEISVIGRNTQGVRLVNLTRGEKLVAVESLPSLENSDSKNEEVE